MKERSGLHRCAGSGIMKRILVVEDETSIREVIALNLKMAGYEVTEAASAEEGLEKITAEGEHDVAILDIMLPGMNGFSLCEQLRREHARMGIIMLSAKTQEADKISALSIGADDYMTKPFSVSELLARIEALCRRHMLFKEGKAIDLTQVEFQIMDLFFHNPGVALVRDKILEGVWGPNYFGDVKIVDVNIRRLRMKIEDKPSDPRHILTVWGYGYRWAE